MMLVTRDRSLSGRETVQAIDYDTFVGQKERPRMTDMNFIHSPLESLADKQTAANQELIFHSLLQQFRAQLHQQEHNSQNPHPYVNHQLSENGPRRVSIPSLDLTSEGQLHQQEHNSQNPHPYVNHQLSENGPRRVSIPSLDLPSEGQLHQQEHESQHPHHDVKYRPRRGSLPSEGFKDITILENDYFVAICDDYIKLYSDTGDLVDKLMLDCTPLSLSRFGKDRMVITCYSRRLCIVNIDNRTSLSLQLEVETVIQYSSVSQLQNDELICAGLDEAVLHRLVYKPGVVALASVLPLVEFGVTIRHDMSYRYIHVTSSGRIVVTDRMNDYLLSLSIKGNWKIPFFYRPQAVVSDDSHIYVIQGGGLNLVYRFNHDGTNALCILRKEHGLVDPWGLSLNRNGKLMVTNNSESVPGVRVFTGLVAF